MATCLTCNREFQGGEQFCPRDGTPLQAQPGGDRLLGRVLSGRYRLEARLGQGGMGAVYRAHHILMDKAVAVKVLRQELSSDAEAVARFHREARSASRLDHDHIIRVTDFGQSDDGQLFLVMELLDGESLAEVVHERPLPWRRAATIMRDVAMGLAHAHEQGIVHRDLKPENIMLARRPKSGRQVVKVLDFGLAKLMHEAGAAVPDTSITRTGVVFGTPEYMSPEQAEGAQLDHRTDIYALGVIGYQMLTGEVPFAAPTFLALITKVVQEEPLPPSRRRPDLELPAELEALVLRCLAKRPADRPQTAEEVIDTLELLLAVHPAALSGERSAPPREPSGVVEAGPEAFAHTLGVHSEPAAPQRPPSGTDAATAAASTPTADVTTVRTEPPLPDLTPDPINETLEPRPRRRWPLAMAALGAVVLAGAALGPRSLRPSPGLPARPAQRDATTRAQELLLDHRVDEALALLEDERRQRNTPLLQRLLSEAYEAKSNRLRALGHMYVALSLSRGGPEEPGARLGLAQLLSRLGYREESCRVVGGLGKGALAGTSGGQRLRQEAEALVRTLRCGGRP